MGNIEERKNKKEAINMLIDILAESGDKHMICCSKVYRLTNKISEIAFNNELSNEKYEGLTNIMEQFETAIDDYIKE